MEIDDTKESLLRRFLLDNISETEREMVEERFLSSEQEFNALEIVEDQLIVDYLRSALPADERKRFETSYMITAARRARVSSARMLLEELSARKRLAVPRAAPVAGVGLFDSWKLLLRPAIGVIAVLVLAVLGIFVFLRQSGGPTEVAVNIPATGASPKSESPAIKDDRNGGNAVVPIPVSPSQTPTPMKQKPAIPAPALATFVLRPGSVRGSSGGNRLTIPPGASEIGLRLVLEADEYPAYSARVTTIDGSSIYTSPRLKSNRSGLLLKVPVRSLGRNDYIVELTGVDANGRATRINDYTFTVLP